MTEKLSKAESQALMEILLERRNKQERIRALEQEISDLKQDLEITKPKKLADKFEMSEFTIRGYLKMRGI